VLEVEYFHFIWQNTQLQWMIVSSLLCMLDLWKNLTSIQYKSRDWTRPRFMVKDKFCIMKTIMNKSWIWQGCTNSGGQVFRATNSYMLAPNICGSWVHNLLHITLLPHRILRSLLDLEHLFNPDISFERILWSRCFLVQFMYSRRKLVTSAFTSVVYLSHLYIAPCLR